MKIVKTLLSLMCFVWCSLYTNAQSHYSIDITNQNYPVSTGFIKTGSNTAANGDVLSYTNTYFTKNDKPWYPTMGEMHFSRCAKKDWENSILKMKACGIQIIAAYIIWIHHEDKEGVFNWEDNNDLAEFLTLCKKHKMYVWLRPGPWVHAEVRHGGFPNWLVSKGVKLRSNNEEYLNATKTFFNEIGKQCKGYYFKENGPIIGVQIENEFEYKLPEQYGHMKKLKQMAIAAGMDVPYYSAFSQGPAGQNEFFHPLGSYPDSPWSTDTKKRYKTGYFIEPLKGDDEIGADLFGKVDNKTNTVSPKFSAEMGAGMQVTYHRRVCVSAKDVVGMAFSKVASGLNGLGYYMFHGGINPIGETTTQESRLTNYPNDMSVMNYDFQSPIGAMGILKDSYKEYKLLNQFVTDFGSALATDKEFFPQKRIDNFFSSDTVKVAARIHNNSGFIFLSNYQRFVDLPAAKNLQLKLNNNKTTDNIPLSPITFPANTYTVWSYNLPLADAVLHYATAQPFCVLNNSTKTFVFFAEDASEFVFDKKTISKIVVDSNCKLVTDNQFQKINIPKNTTTLIKVFTNKNTLVNVLLLPKNLALQANKITLKDKELVVFANDNLTVQENVITLEHIDKLPNTTVQIFPANGLKSNNKNIVVQNKKDNPLFSNYTIRYSNNLKAIADFKIKPTSVTDTALQLQDSILKTYAASKKFNPLQPGPLYQTTYKAFPNQNLYNVNLDAPTNNILKDWIADINYAGDMVAFYKNDKLIYDQFNYNNNCKIKLSEFDLTGKSTFTSQLFSFKVGNDVYVEDEMQQSKKTEWTNAHIKALSLTSVFEYVLQID
jgi:beta-galactosidase